MWQKNSKGRTTRMLVAMKMRSIIIIIITGKLIPKLKICNRQKLPLLVRMVLLSSNNNQDLDKWKHKLTLHSEPIELAFLCIHRSSMLEKMQDNCL
jgi:hypothetical protein